MFCACDQPLVSRESLKKMIASFCEDPGLIYRLCYGQIIGNPVIFPSSDFEQLKHLPENNGGSVIMREYPHRVQLVSAQSPYELMDADTPNELEKLEKIIVEH